MTIEQSTRKTREAVPLFVGVITDIQVDLISELNEKEKAFWKTLHGKRKDYFLYMDREAREQIIDNKLSEENIELLWKHASKLLSNMHEGKSR